MVVSGNHSKTSVWPVPNYQLLSCIIAELFKKGLCHVIRLGQPLAKRGKHGKIGLHDPLQVPSISRVFLHPVRLKPHWDIWCWPARHQISKWRRHRFPAWRQEASISCVSSWVQLVPLTIPRGPDKKECQLIMVTPEGVYLHPWKTTGKSPFSIRNTSSNGGLNSDHSRQVTIQEPWWWCELPWRCQGSKRKLSIIHSLVSPFEMPGV